MEKNTIAYGGDDEKTLLHVAKFYQINR